MAKNLKAIKILRHLRSQDAKQIYYHSVLYYNSYYLKYEKNYRHNKNNNVSHFTYVELST